MTCVYEAYEVKIKMAQEQWLHLQLKRKFLLGYSMKILIWGGGGEGHLTFDGGSKNLVGESILGYWEDSSRWEDEQILGW